METSERVAVSKTSYQIVDPIDCMGIRPNENKVRAVIIAIAFQLQSMVGCTVSCSFLSLVLGAALQPQKATSVAKNPAIEMPNHAKLTLNCSKRGTAVPARRIPKPTPV